MCGIVGDVDISNQSLRSESIVRQMLGSIRHRGPDEFGIYLDDTAALGNARLSIVDLTAGQQPISTPSGRFWTVFNGEIFNHQELRSELEAIGHQFKTHCDTEVFVHLFEEFGASCLGRINGQFGAAVWDAHRRQLFLARDRLGIRPVFYHHAGTRLIFASEIKALACHPDIDLAIREQGIQQVFEFWSCQGGTTAFAGIEQLKPGHFAVFSPAGLSTRCYWSPELTPQRPEEVTEQDALARLHETLASATRLRLQADVPVGAYLSGGLDSSLIAALVKENTSGKFDTFSIAFTDTDFDESQHQQAVARHLGTNHQVVEASHSDIARVFPDVIWHTETPILRTAPAPMFLLSQLVQSAGYKVVLTGEGADEFFAGYDIFKEAKIREFWAREPESIRRSRLLERIYPDIKTLSRLGPAYTRSFFGNGVTETGDPDYSHRIRWANTARARRYFSEHLKSALSNDFDPKGQVDAGTAITAGILERAQQTEIRTFLSPYLLSSQGDRMGMAHSVEGRFPFLDPNVVALASSLPLRLKMPAIRDKFLLRKLGKDILPSAIWKRPKKPYRAPIHTCFIHERAPDYVRDLLSDHCLADKGFFDPRAVGLLIKRIRAGQTVGEVDDMALAGILSTQLLHEQFIANPKRTEPIDNRDNIKLIDHRRAAANISRSP